MPHLLLPLLLTVACKGDDPQKPDVFGLFESECASMWPVDECAAADCASTDVEARYAEGWEAWYQQMSGLSDADMADHVRLRNIETVVAKGSSATDVWYNIDIGWIRIVRYMTASAPGEDPSSEEIDAAFAEWASFPALDYDVSLVPYETAQAWIDECAASLEVAFSLTGWCEAYLPSLSGDEDGIRFDFSVDLGDDRIATASVDVTDEEDAVCDVIVPDAP